jgi:ESCRT-II complex subunit VPS36
MVRDETKYHQGLAQELGHLLTGSKGSGQGLMTGKVGRGIIGLDEVWGLWMRARGVGEFEVESMWSYVVANAWVSIALLPPSTLIAILPYIPSATSPPIHLLSLPSSLKVLHTPSFAPPAMLARLLSRLGPARISTNGQYGTSDDQLAAKDKDLPGVEESLSLIEISSYESIPIGLAKELMESIERLSPPEGLREVFGLVRDDQAQGGSTRWYRDIISPWEL